MENRFDPAPAPRFDEECARKFLKIIHPNDNPCIEIRLISPGKSNVGINAPQTFFFNSIDSAVEIARKNNGKKSIFVGLQPRPCDLFHKFTPNSFSPEGATDKDIRSIEWLFIDVDSNAPKGMSSTDLEKENVNKIVDKITDVLCSQGFSPYIIGDSGNGGHILSKTGGLADASLWEKNSPLKKFLEYLKKYEEGNGKVDTSTFNPSRMIKLYGTAAVKGRNTIERPHRTATFRIFEGKHEL